MNVAFQGEPGAYSHQAILETFGRATEALPCHTFAEAFDAVEQGTATLAMIPIENSTAGAINQSYDLLLDHNLTITREVVLPVRHALLVPSGTPRADIVRVYSHPAALAQCEHFITSNGWEPVVAYDTAGAAKLLAASREPHAAALASAIAGEIYGLDILAQSVQDLANNYTRFFVIGHDAPPRTDNCKTSLVLETAHSPGSLYRVLGEFASRAINLTKLESRPDRKNPWHYIFYIDLQTHRADPLFQAALVALRDKTVFLKVLGSYPAAPTPPTEL